MKALKRLYFKLLVLLHLKKIKPTIIYQKEMSPDFQFNVGEYLFVYQMKNDELILRVLKYSKCWVIKVGAFEKWLYRKLITKNLHHAHEYMFLAKNNRWVTVNTPDPHSSILRRLEKNQIVMR